MSNELRDRITITIRPDLLATIDSFAKDDGRSRSNAVEVIIDEWLALKRAQREGHPPPSDAGERVLREACERLGWTYLGVGFNEHRSVVISRPLDGPVQYHSFPDFFKLVSF